MARKNKTKNVGKDQSAGPLGFEAKLWQAADKLRSNMDAAEYKHVVLGLIFLKYISDAFEEQHAELEARARRRAPIPRTRTNTAPRTSSGCRRRRAGRTCKASAKQPDDRQARRRRHGRHRARQPALKGVLPKDYARPGLDKQRLGELIDLIGNIGARRRGRPRQGHRSAASTNTSSPSSPAPRARTAASSTRRAPSSAAGRDARALQGPRLRPLLRLRRHVRAVARSSSRRTAASSATSRIYGQEINPTTWRLAMMNLAMRGIEADLGPSTPTPSTATSTPTSRPTTSSPTRRSTTPTGAASAARRRALEVRRAAGRQRQLRLGAALHPPPRAARAWPASCSPTARMSSQPVRRRRDPQGHHRGRPRRLHGRAAGPALLLEPSRAANSPPEVADGSRPATDETRARAPTILCHDQNELHHCRAPASRHQIVR